MTNIFGHTIRSEMLLLFVAEALVCFLAFYLILGWGLGDPSEVASPAALLLLAGGLAACSGLISGASGLYQPAAWQRVRRLFGGIVVACLLLLLLAQLLLHAALPFPTRAAWLTELLLAFAGALLVTRLGFLLALRSGLLRCRLVLVHAANEAPRNWRPDPLLDVVKAVPASPDVGASLSAAALSAQRVSMVVTGVGVRLAPPQVAALRAARIAVVDEVEFEERRSGRVDLARLRPDWLASAWGAQHGPGVELVRRALDIASAMTLLLVALPVIALAALAIKLDSPGPVFYRQERVGRGGRVFTLFKFRSMVQDAEAKGGPAWARKRDPRVTRVGRFLRLTRIDEIPQVFNVLKGDMAFVGPRPERPQFVAQLAEIIPHYRDREVVKPGITGWAQVNYPYGASVEDSRNKLAFDLYYVKRRSLFLDLLILVGTVRVVLFQEGSR